MSSSRRRYSTDLTDAEWVRLAPLVPLPKRGGRPARDRREIINAISYVVRTGCAWRLLPHDFPPWQTVYHYFRRWRMDGTWERMHDALREQVREQAGRNQTPSAGIIDSQSVRTTEKGGSGAMTAPSGSTDASGICW
jgi:transposase